MKLTKSESSPIVKEGSADPISEKLFSEVESLKTQRNLLKDRLSKAEAEKSKFSDDVFQKIAVEYGAKIHDLGQELALLKEKADKEVQVLSQKKDSLETELAQHKRVVEEAQFRETIGEYDTEKAATIEKTEGVEIQRLQSEIDQVNEKCTRTQSLFEGEELPEQATESVRPTASSVPTRSESNYLSLPEEDEFKGELPTTKEEILEKTDPKKIVPFLVQIEEGQEVQRFSLQGNLSLGRSPTNDIVISEPRVSRKHALIEKRKDEFVLIDLDSSNGTFIKSKKIQEHIFKSGDEFRIAGVRFVFKSGV
ncbi:MAG: FHA domain-containing protein [bacterium]|nr:FHA domain-containing protein [bacterium]